MSYKVNTPSGWKMSNFWRRYCPEIETNGQGMTIGSMKTSIIDKVIQRVFQVHYCLLIMFRQYPISATPRVCLSTCQNFDFTSEMYPFPVWILSWLNGVYMGTVLTSPCDLKTDFRHMCMSSPMASSTVSQNPTLLIKL